MNWQPLRQELALWRRDRLTLPLWWRDDDAVTETPELHRLLDLSERLGLPVHLAVIPKHAQVSLANLCRSRGTPVLVHGWSHDNHADAERKKAEFGAQTPRAIAELSMGLDRLGTLLGESCLPVFVPPWNRIDPALFPHLRDAGYRAVSTFTPRKAAEAAPGLKQVNTHLDPIFWKAGGGLRPADELIAQITDQLADRRADRADNAEPYGLLTHHLVHDDAIWAFTERCVTELLDGGAEPSDLRAHLGD